MQKESEKQWREVLSRKLEMKGKKDEHHCQKLCTRALQSSTGEKNNITQKIARTLSGPRQILKNKKILYDFWHYKNIQKYN